MYLSFALWNHLTVKFVFKKVYVSFHCFNLGVCEFKELTKCEGEASANNRKAKLIFFYEFEIKGEWSGNILLMFYKIKVLYFQKIGSFPYKETKADL